MTHEQLAAMRRDFRLFLYAVWHHHGLPEPTPAQYDIAWWLQHGPDDLGVKAERGEGKTWITAAFLAWLLFCDPNERILLISKSEGHSEKTLKLVSDWIKSIPWLQYLSPIKGSKQKDSTTEFDVGPSRTDRMASITALGITGSLAGNRATIIVPDDIEDPENTQTAALRKKLRRRIEEFENIRVPGSRVIVLGTPHHEESIYDHMAEIGYSFRCWPARYPTKEERTDDLAPSLAKALDSGKAAAGDIVSPTRFTEEYFKAKAKKLGPAAWAMQFMLITRVADEQKAPLKCRDLIVYPCHRDHAPASISWGRRDHNGSTEQAEIHCPGIGDDAWYGPIFVAERHQPYQGTVAWLDPSGSRNDPWAWSIGGQLNGYIHAKCVGTFEGQPTVENLGRVVADLKRHGAQQLFIESNFGGDMVAQMIKPLIARATAHEHDIKYPDGWACSVETVHTPSNSGQKERRIIGILDPLFAAHRVVVDPSVAENHQFGFQISHITKVRDCLELDDIIDSFAGMCSRFTDVLDQDAETMAEEEAAKNDEGMRFEAFMDEQEEDQEEWDMWATI